MPTLRSFVAAALGAVATTCLVSTAAFSRSPLPAGRVKPNLEFGALVNGTSSNPIIQMGCFGAVRPGERGHPMPGQTLEVFRPEALQVPGFTGTGAGRIVATFSDDTSAVVPFARFSRLKAVPTSLSLPCTGTGQVVFAPRPSSPTAQSAVVTVQYVGQP
jgi:hypothetical protein